MFEEIVRHIITELKPAELLEEVRGELYAASIRQSATLIFLALRSGADEATDSLVRRSVEMALELDHEIEERLGDDSP